MKKAGSQLNDFSTSLKDPSPGPQDSSFGHIAPISLDNPQYPQLLKEIPDPPKTLYVRGGKAHFKKPVAIVGARAMTSYGKNVTKQLVTDLVKHGCTIISGMALGIDTIAHQTALDGGGTTIAVLGCGIDIIYPNSNARLYWDIVRDGAVVSEFGPGAVTTIEQFKTRNRIISGLSLGVVVIEGTDKSGALITAKYALEQGREVFAVPGPITSPLSRASSILLQNGAKLVESASDILEEL